MFWLPHDFLGKIRPIYQLSNFFFVACSYRSLLFVLSRILTVGIRSTEVIPLLSIVFDSIDLTYVEWFAVPSVVSQRMMFSLRDYYRQ